MLGMARVKLDMKDVAFVFPTDLDVRTFDLMCRVVRVGDSAGGALAKTGMVALDYAANRAANLPAEFLEKTGVKSA